MAERERRPPAPESPDWLRHTHLASGGGRATRSQRAGRGARTRRGQRARPGPPFGGRGRRSEGRTPTRGPYQPALNVTLVPVATTWTKIRPRTRLISLPAES